MNASSPTKRRALAPLDVNISINAPGPSPPSPSSQKLLAHIKPSCPNAASPLKMEMEREASRSSSTIAASASSQRKRPVSPALEKNSEVQEPPAKKKCHSPVPSPDACRESTVGGAEENEQPSDSQSTTTTRRSVSPAASSVFDSAINLTQVTNITEPDMNAPPVVTAGNAATQITSAGSVSLQPAPSRPRRMLTREESRQQAQMIKLRLSLAHYKIKTGQEDVPLEKLQMRPVPGMPRSRTPLPSTSAHTVQRATPAQRWYRSGQQTASYLAYVQDQGRDDEEDNDDDDDDDDDDDEENEGKQSRHVYPSSERHVLPKLTPASTPRRSRFEDEENLTSSAIRGGAAKGLLSLSQG